MSGCAVYSTVCICQSVYVIIERESVCVCVCFSKVHPMNLVALACRSQQFVVTKIPFGDHLTQLKYVNGGSKLRVMEHIHTISTHKSSGTKSNSI